MEALHLKSWSLTGDEPSRTSSRRPCALSLDVAIDDDLCNVEPDNVDTPFSSLRLCERMESAIHHVAHWIMLWAQVQTAFVISKIAKEYETDDLEVTLSMIAVLMLCIGICASGGVILRNLITCFRTGLHLQRWCQLLTISSCGFSILQVLCVFVVRDRGSCAFVTSVFVFRLNAIAWGLVSTYLWYSYEKRRRHSSEENDDEESCCPNSRVHFV